MRTKLAAAAVLLLARPAAAVPFLLSGINQTVPDNNIVGVSSVLNVSGLRGAVTGVQVYLEISGGHAGDLYASLSKEEGPGFAVLLNRIGRDNGQPGYYGAGLNIVLSDAAPGDVHLSGANAGLLTGAWQPDARETDPDYTMSFDARGAFLASFNGMNPNGDWALFIADLDGGGESVLISWGVMITTDSPAPVPENPATGPLFASALLLTGLMAAKIRGRPGR